MKKLYIGILALGCMSTAFGATEKCPMTVKYQAFDCIKQSDICNDVKRSDLKRINKTLAKKGYFHHKSVDLWVDNESINTKYILTFSSAGTNSSVDLEEKNQNEVDLRASFDKTSFFRDGREYRVLAKKLPHCSNL